MDFVTSEVIRQIQKTSRFLFMLNRQKFRNNFPCHFIGDWSLSDENVKSRCVRFMFLHFALKGLEDLTTLAANGKWFLKAVLPGCEAHSCSCIHKGIGRFRLLRLRTTCLQIRDSGPVHSSPDPIQTRPSRSLHKKRHTISLTNICTHITIYTSSGHHSFICLEVKTTFKHCGRRKVKIIYISPHDGERQPKALLVVQDNDGV